MKMIEDGMKKESKLSLILIILGYGVTILILLCWLFGLEEENIKAIIMLCIFQFMLGTFGLYSWLYAIKYKLEFDNEKIHLKTLFRKIELNVKDIEKYTIKRYRKSEFFQFNLFIKDKKVLINTRYKDEFIKILSVKHLKNK